MLKVILGFGVITFAFQIAGTSVLKCDKFQTQENLNMERMLGRWHFLRDKYGNNEQISCLFINLQKYEADKFSFDVCDDSNGLSCHTFAYLTSSGEFSGKNTDNSTNYLTPAIYYVGETDYDNYAVFHVQICPENLIMILSRRKIFGSDDAEINKLTQKYFNGTSVSWMSFKTNCSKNTTNL